MYCINCGTQIDDGAHFCYSCGAKQTAESVTAPAPPEDSPKEETSTPNFNKVKHLLIDPSETIKSILCNNFLQTFISTGMLGNGFAILTDKRVYFKGKCYLRKGKGFYSKTEEKTVDLKDVTGTGFVHNKAVWAKILKIIALVFAISGSAIYPLVFLTGEIPIAEIPAAIFALGIYWGLYFLFCFLYKRFNYSVFEISYAGGGIAFDMGWITQQESKEFQQQLVLLKQAEKEQAAPVVFSRPENTSSIPQQLKEYKELLDSGIITQEEFDTKKRELLVK